ncbi:hypothetical protein MHBO_004964, partial [Bonamia ostreae]
MSTLVENLVKRDPEKRPGSTEDLLVKKLIPFELVDSSLNNVLEELSKSDSVFRSKALKKLFSSNMPGHLNYTYDSLMIGSLFFTNFAKIFRSFILTKRNDDNLNKKRIKANLSKRIREIFEKHGFFNFETPLLMPSIPGKKNNGRLM